MNWVDPALLAAGGLILYLGGELMVNSAVRTAGHLKVTPYLIGATVVAFGTSAPELVVSVVAALENSPDISISNVVGSNIANVGLIVGLCALVAPMPIEKRRFRREVPVLVAATALTAALLYNMKLARWEGALLLLGMAAYLWFCIRGGKVQEGDAHEVPDGSRPAWADALLLIASIGLLILGGRLMVSGGVGVARAFGVSEWAIGATIVALGTSAPEVAASVISARRGKPEIAFANVVGSNVFNMFMVLGLAAFLMPLNATGDFTPDLAVMIAMTILLIIAARTGYRISRGQGLVLLAGYAGYLVYCCRVGA